MFDLLQLYCNGYVATPIIEACLKHRVFTILDRKEYRDYNYLVKELKPNTGYLKNVLQVLESLGWLEKSSDDAYRVTGKANTKIDLNLTSLYGLEPFQLIHEVSFAQMMSKKIEEVYSFTQNEESVTDTLIHGAVMLPLIKGLKDLKVERFCEELNQLDPKLRQTIEKIFIKHKWLTDDKSILTTAGKQILQTPEIDIVVSHRPLLYSFEDILFGDLSNEREKQSKLLGGNFRTIYNSKLNENYHEDLMHTVKTIFNQHPLEKQPKAIVCIGSGNEKLLKEICNLICNQTVRGQNVKQFPIEIFDIDNSPFILEKQNVTFDYVGIKYCTISVDIINNAEVRKVLEKNGLSSDKETLYISSFADRSISINDQQLKITSLDTLSETQSGCYIAREGQLLESQTVFRYWQKYLETWAQCIHNSSMLTLEAHSIPIRAIDNIPDSTGTFYFDTLNRISCQSLISAETFIIMAANVGLFGKNPVKRYPKMTDNCQISLNHFVKRNYIVRYAAEKDLQSLYELEDLCWSEKLRTPQRQIRARLQKYPQGQFVLEKEGQVLGVVYSQRIANTDDITKCNMDNVHELHQESGSIIQLIAVNIHPNAQNLNYGDQLLEFMLQRCSVTAGVKKIAAVTLCKKFDSKGMISFEKYIRLQGSERDPILEFHNSHGANIVKSIANYRPRDKANLGNGVLVEYDIHNRVRPDQIMKTTTEKLNTNTIVTKQQISSYIHESVSELLNIDKDKVDLNRPVMEMGLNSADLLVLQRKIEVEFYLELQSGFFFEYSSINKVIDYLTEKLAVVSEIKNDMAILNKNSKKIKSNVKDGPTQVQSVLDIAIIGMSCRLPGGIDSPEKLWKVLASGDCVISSYPEERGKWINAHNKPGIDQGGFIKDAEAFDASFFRMSPSEAQITDPQQRILMELAWACLEDANILPSIIKGTNSGVFIGASNNDYSRLIQEAKLETQAHYATGSSLAVLANRISYFFDLTGPSLLIDTACSSSLVALHTAIRSLRSGECSSALVGGVNFICHPDLSMAYYRAGMLASDGRCKVFDTKANGYVRSEGAVMLMLKPLSLAIKDQNQIHAVIKGSAINHGGLAAGLTVPNPQKQSELLISAWKNSGISAQDLSYIEAHGTGTSLGDPIEIQGIQNAYFKLVEKNLSRTIGIGSVKSNLGHLEPAAGITGLLKVILSMKYQQLPATINFSELNPKIRLNDTFFYIQNKHTNWDANQPRLAGVSSFGSGGANAHVVIQEYVSHSNLNNIQNSYLFVLSAHNQDLLKKYVEKVIKWLNDNECEDSFANAIYSWQIGRTAMKNRLAIKINGPQDLKNKLEQWLVNESALTDTWFGQANTSDSNMVHLWKSKKGQQLIDLLFSEKDIEHLGIIWTSGIDLEWKKLYTVNNHEGNLHQFISVPTYPFDKQKYWIDKNDKQNSTSALINEDEEKRGVFFAKPTWQQSSTESLINQSRSEYDHHYIIICEIPQYSVQQIETVIPHCHCIVLSSQETNFADRYSNIAIACFEQIQKIISNRLQGKILLQIVVAQNQEQTFNTGLIGLLKTANLEYPQLIGQVINIESKTTISALAEQLMENQIQTYSSVVKYESGIRYNLGWEPIVEPNEKIEISFKENGIYLITGGLGGLGLTFAREILAKTRNAKVILTGRAQLTTQKKRTLETFSADNNRIIYMQVDICNSAEVNHMFTEVMKEHKQLNGIFHCAGMISDNFIIKKTTEEFRKVLEPKVNGTYNLDMASQDINLDFFVLFSSIVGVIGNIGQADYASANGFMDQFAAYRNYLAGKNKRHGTTLSINWPLWKEGGMTVDQTSQEVLLQTTGMVPMQTSIGIEAFHKSIMLKECQTLLIEGILSRINKTFGEKKQTSCLKLNNGQRSAIDTTKLYEKTLQKVKQVFGKVTKLSISKIDGYERISSYGIDSIFINQLNVELAKVFGEISKTLFFEYQTLADLTIYLTKEYSNECLVWTGLNEEQINTPVVHNLEQPLDREVNTIQTKITNTETPNGNVKQPIAIIGISGIYPHAANIDKYWDNLKAGRNCISEIPYSRWPMDGFYEQDEQKAIEQGKSYCKWGGYIDQFSQFDPLFFGISPRDAMNIDPQERLFLQESWRVLECSGYTNRDLKEKFKRKIGVFAGITKTGFELYGSNYTLGEEKFHPRTSFGSVANRISYLLDLTGPSIPIDTMCSSSLTAIHEACEHINRGECKMAFAGGVNIYLHPYSYIWLSTQYMLSKDGLCKSFGADGNGFVPGEGVGVVLLKPLSAAIEDNDTIHGIILSSSMNHGGKTNGYTVPNPKAHAELIADAINKAGISARDISYIEAHGTGTKLGDPIEISGLQQAFAKNTKDIGFCKIGSVKSNIGHLEAAAGIAGLTKILLQMKHKQIAPSLHVKKLNPNIDFSKTPFVVNQTLTKWDNPVVDGLIKPRIAGISSFGAGGSNAHVIVQEYVAPKKSKLPDVQTKEINSETIILLSAKTVEQLKQRAHDLLGFINNEKESIDLNDMAYTLQVGREAMNERLGFIVSSIDQLTDKLQDFINGQQEIENTFKGQASSSKEDVNVIHQDEDMNEVINKWIIRKKYSKLLDLWVKGLDLDWNKLYEENRPKRISLPTYPFAQEKYWIDSLDIVQTKTSTSFLHPLLHCNTSNLNQQCYSTTLTGREFFLADHKVQGQMVLPGVTYLEMAREAIENGISSLPEGTILELHNIVWIQPVVVSSNKEVSIALFRNDLEEQFDEIDFEIYSIEDENSKETIHCQGNGIILNKPISSKIDIVNLKALMKKGKLEAEEVYSFYKTIGIAFGKGHQGIYEIYQGEREVLAQIRLPESVYETYKDYYLHPSLMDSTLQATVGLLFDNGKVPNRPLLPFAMESLRIISALPIEIFAWIRYSQGCKPEDIITKLDIDIFDKEGNICVQMKGFSSRVLEGELELSDKDTAHDNIQGEVKAGLNYLTPVWNPILAITNQEKHVSESEKILLLRADQNQLNWVKKSFSNVDLMEMSDKSIVDYIEEKIKKYSFDHLIWIAPDVTMDKNSDSRNEKPNQIVNDQECGVIEVYHIVKALLKTEYAEKNLKLTIITGRTQLVKRNDRLEPTHSGIIGFVGSIAKEIPHWNIRLLDIDSLENVTAIECLSLPSDKQGNGLAYRDGEWFKPDLAYLTNLPKTNITYKQKGVYVVIGGAGGIGEVWSRFLIENYDAQVIWIGRREENEKIKLKIKEFSQLGTAPIYISADATNVESLENAFRRIIHRYPIVNGVIHSAIILQDQSIINMEESKFRAGLSAKIDVSVNMEKVFGELNLDFMLFFSSLISFIKTAGQSNYSAGCTFKDSFAKSLQKKHPYPVKIMNWGFWGKVGIVADEFYNKRMEQMGIGSIEPQESMEVLQEMMGSQIDQMALMKTLKIEAISDYNIANTITYYPEMNPIDFEKVINNLKLQDDAKQLAALEGELSSNEINYLATEILTSSLVTLGLFNSGNSKFTDLKLEKLSASFYEKWLMSSINYLQDKKILTNDLRLVKEPRVLNSLWIEWENKKSVWMANPNIRAWITLLETCLNGLPSILSGKQPSTDIIFPNSSMQLVEGIYKGNAIADYYNNVLSRTLKAFIEQKLSVNKEIKIRILEIGAGTGGTTAKLLPILQQYSNTVIEYCYTDLSKAFLIHAEENYQPKFSALRTCIFDVSKPLISQSVKADRYDFIIATNVLHATKNIRETLRNAKAALKNKGILLLNEMSSWSLFNHLTFGLLEGWWLYEDNKLRIPGSPGLTPAKWEEVLCEEGFDSIYFPAKNAIKFGQQIIVGLSDGIVKQKIRIPVLSNVENTSFNKEEPKTVKVEEKLITKKSTNTNNNDFLREEAISYFQKLIAKTLKIDPQRIEPNQPLEKYGLDSILVIQLTNQFRTVFKDITSTLFFEAQSITGLADYFLENKKDALSTILTGSISKVATKQVSSVPDTVVKQEQKIVYEQKSMRSVRANNQKSFRTSFNSKPPSSIVDVAIIGLSGIYPQADNLDEFWSNLSRGVNCISEIPKDRWDWKEYFDPEKGKHGKIYTKYGGFIKDIDKFDPLFFKISPKEARKMDPQERLFLEACYHAIEDAGYTPENLGEIDKIGVFAGVMNARYTKQPLHFSIANRISYLFNFQGPSMAVDTACSSSLTAIHLALESIYSGLSTCVIAGGVNLIIDPVHYLELTEMTMLSSSSECKAFGDKADGFIDSEGVGAIILKPLKKAEQDGDHIYGVIKASAINAGGKTNGYTVPNPKAQSAVISKALQRAGIEAEQVSYIEAHGTGTALGDPIEIAGLTRAFKDTTLRNQFCAIGSVKSNIGHCESAAGIAGLTKILLQFKYKQLVPSLHSDVVNHEIDFNQTPFKIQKNLEKWQRPLLNINGTLQEIPRIAGISSFGAGGANAHIILQEYDSPSRINNLIASPESDAKVIIPLSARTIEQLKEKALNLLNCILKKKNDPEFDYQTLNDKSIDLKTLSYTLQTGREAMEERLGFLVSSVDELVNKLQAYIDDHDVEDIYIGQVKCNRESMNIISQDDDMVEAVAKWIERKKYTKLLDLWVKGLNLDWNKLYDESKPNRISLPGYPFAKERYWIEKVETDQTLPNHNNVVIHPLLHTNISDFNQQSYCSYFTGEEFFIKDYKMTMDDGVAPKIFPAVLYMEMARIAVEKANNSKQEHQILELQKIVWAQPMEVTDNRSVTIALLAKKSDQVDFEIYSEDNGEENVYCQGQAVFSKQIAQSRIDIQKIKAQMKLTRLEASSIYNTFSKSGIYYGPAYQSISCVYKGYEQLLAEISLPGIMKKIPNEYYLHPSVVDGALQTVYNLIEPRYNVQPSIPLEIESVRLLSNFTNNMFVWARYSQDSNPKESNIKFDLDLCDQQGYVCIQLRGVSYQKDYINLIEQISEQKRIPEILPKVKQIPLEHKNNLQSKSHETIILEIPSDILTNKSTESKIINAIKNKVSITLPTI